MTAGAAGAASLITSGDGYTGPVLSFGSYADQPFTNTAGPVDLSNGITFTSTVLSVIGMGGYGLDGNGFLSSSNIIGTNDPEGVITLSFATPVASFGAGFNYSPGDGSDPTISAYDFSNNLIASYDLATLAPISTPGGQDVFLFRGIDGGGSLISSFTLSGSYIVAAATFSEPTPTPGVPEPASWALMLTGFGLAGGTLRLKRRAASVPG